VNGTKVSEMYFLEFLVMRNGTIKCVNPKIILRHFLVLHSFVKSLSTQL